MAQQANLAYYYVTGPVHIFMRVQSVGAGPYKPPGTPSAGIIQFVGHCEESPEPDFTPHYLPVKSSLSGPEVEDDEIFAGGEYSLDLTLSRFNFSVIQQIKSFPRFGRAGTVPGTETFLDRGRLLLTQGDSFELWLQNAFFGTPNAAAYPDLPPGYYFPAVRPAKILPQNLTRDTKKAHLLLRPKSVRIGVTGGYMSFSQDPQWFVGLPLPG